MSRIVGQRCGRTSLAGVAVLPLLLAAVATVSPAQVPSPTLEGPVTGGGGKPIIGTTSFDLAEVGYMQEEFFISGTATAYTSADPLTSDGNWSVTAASTAPYKTRILVYRPAQTARFRGTVVVEWLNVSAGADLAVDWIHTHTEMVRSGITWVGVSAQALGVVGGTAAAGGIKNADPARYGSLDHPGDSFSFDIFSQAGQAIRAPSGTDPLGGLKVKRVLAIGDSQSAARLTTYIDGVDPLARIYDGFLVHSRAGGASSLSQSPLPQIDSPSPTLIREDVQVPVLVFETETDLIGYFAARQPDTDHIRLWEVAGTSHADTYTVSVGFGDLGNDPAVANLVVATFGCGLPINSGPHHFVLNAALKALNRWVKRGKPPAEAPRVEVLPGSPPSIARDALGNALGGIRTPQLDVPIATLSGVGQSGPGFCRLYGTMAPFDAATLASLYPDHHAYVSAYVKATRQAVRGRYLVRRDAKLLKANARESAIPN
jgi:hypothetical protein